MPPAITTLCADGDVQKILSVVGVKLRVDDDAAALQWAREEAAVDILGYVGLQYSPTALANSNWVLRRAAWLAARHLCSRRGNPVPGVIRKRCEQIEAQLQAVQDGRPIPDAPQSKQSVPVLSNQRVRLVPIPQVQTEPGRSTGKQQGYSTNNDQYDVTDYTQ